MQTDGRYLLVTNDWHLSPQEMMTLYRRKDGVEKRFQITKGELKVSPVYLHKDERIEAMLLVLAATLFDRDLAKLDDRAWSGWMIG